MTTVQVQVRLPKELAATVDKWVAEGRFASRSDAVKEIISFYREREKTRAFYEMLTARSKQAKKNPQSLVPLD